MNNFAGISPIRQIEYSAVNINISCKLADDLPMILHFRHFFILKNMLYLFSKKESCQLNYRY